MVSRSRPLSSSCGFARYRLPTSEDKSVSSVDSYQFGQFIPNTDIGWVRLAHGQQGWAAAPRVLRWVESQCVVLNEGYYINIRTYIRFRDLKANGSLLQERQLIDQQRRKAGILISTPGRDNIWATKEQLDVYPPIVFSTPPIGGMPPPESRQDGNALNPRAQWFTPQPKPHNYNVQPGATASMPRIMDPDSLSDNVTSDFDALHIHGGQYQL